MPKGRETTLIIGATGSLGVPLVTELRRRGHHLRLIGRSWESFVTAGYAGDNDVDLVVCADVTSRDAFPDEWFHDVSCVICVARPRSLKKGDSASYHEMIDNISDAVCVNGVPRLLIHGIPYLDGNQFGESPTMSILKNAESSARHRFEGCDTSSTLTISRMCELSEILHIIESVEMIGFFPCASGCNPLLHPVSARDFATAIADFAEDEACTMSELLVGGPQRITWRALGQSISRSRQDRISLWTFPLFMYKTLIMFLSVLSRIFPALRGLCLSLRMIVIPMTANTANDSFIYIGSDDVDSFIQGQGGEVGDGWVHKKVFGSDYQESKGGIRKQLDKLLPSRRTLAQIFGIFAGCDGAMALLKPGFQGWMLNLDVDGPTIDNFLVREFGIAASSIAVTSLLSLREGDKDVVISQSLGCGIVARFMLNALFLYCGDTSNVAATGSNVRTWIFALFNVMSVVALLLLIRNEANRMMGTKILSFLTISVSLFHYFLAPTVMHDTFGVNGALDDKTLQHFRQASAYDLGSGVQMLALSYGLEADSAAGVVCLVWFLCSIDLSVAKVAARIGSSVFEMPFSARAINFMIPIWTSIISAEILFRQNLSRSTHVL
mmetsp:Transcript_11160/g.22838  ORF Transcript_11160/g.22838 Transcript_11160/m.22838 type:complete len:609 (+) Transcript_11160:135-1961(+)